MSRPDRIPVPTNGHRPPLDPDANAAPVDGTGDVGASGDLDAAGGRVGVGPIASPAQLAVGFGIIAGLILVILGRRRRRR